MQQILGRHAQPAYVCNARGLEDIMYLCAASSIVQMVRFHHTLAKMYVTQTPIPPQVASPLCNNDTVLSPIATHENDSSIDAKIVPSSNNACPTLDSAMQVRGAGRVTNIRNLDAWKDFVPLLAQFGYGASDEHPISAASHCDALGTVCDDLNCEVLGLGLLFKIRLSLGPRKSVTPSPVP